MSSNTLSLLIGEGLESFEDAAAPLIDADPNPEPSVPSIDVTICPVEVEVVEAATDAAKAEVILVASAEAVTAAEELVDAQTEVVINTVDVVASMESFVGSPMSKYDALALQQRVVQATKGSYMHVVGSLEAFGTDVNVDDALNAGLEGLGDFLKEARGKLASLTSVMRAKMATFFKDAFVSFDKVSKRAEAVGRLAKGTTGESNSSALQIPLDTAWHLVREGKLITNLVKELPELGKLCELVLKTSTEDLSDHRKKFIELVSPLTSVELEPALKIAKQVAAWRVPKPAFAKTKIQTSSRTVDVYRSDILLGDKAIYVSMPLDTSKPSDNLNRRLDAVADMFFSCEVSVDDVAKKPAKLDLAVDTLKPAEIVKITEEIGAILGDIKLYAKRWGEWDEHNTELDRLMNVLMTIGWHGDTTVYQGTDEDGTVHTSDLNTSLAHAIWYINGCYGFLSTVPVSKFVGKTIVTLNRILEVCERSLATYSDNNLK